jgi:hypothetical protein
MNTGLETTREPIMLRFCFICITILCLPTLAAAAWTFETRADPMSDDKTTFAWTRSTNFHQLPFPYQGRTHATLILRHHNGKEPQVRLDIDRGQFMCHDECRSRIRFDDNETDSFQTFPPADLSHDTVFIGHESNFIERALPARRIRIEVQMFQAGTRMFEFDVRGLSWPPPERPASPARRR